MPQTQVYEQTCTEIKQGHIVPHLWARAVCEAEGDERDTQRLYLKYRSEELSQQRKRGWQPGDPCRRQRREVAFTSSQKLSQYRAIGSQPAGQLLSIQA